MNENDEDATTYEKKVLVFIKTALLSDNLSTSSNNSSFFIIFAGDNNNARPYVEKSRDKDCAGYCLFGREG